MNARALTAAFPAELRSGWQLRPFWTVAERVKKVGWPNEELLSVYLGRGVIRHAEASDYTHAPSEDLGAYQLVEPGDLVMNNQQAFRGCVGVSKYRGITSPAYLVFRLSPELHPRYASYLFADSLMVSQYGQVSRGVGTIQRQVGPDDLRRVSVLLPPVAHQLKIADYLDAETARIEALIAKKQRMIELLEQRVESLLAVVLEPLIERWGEAPLKSVAAIDVSNIDKKSYDGQQAVRLCNYTDVYYNPTITSRLDFMVATADPSQIRRMTLRQGDVLITKDSETAEDIAVPAWVAEDLAGVVLGYHLALIRPYEGDGRFLYWGIRSRRCRDAFSLAASGVTRVGLRRDEMARVRVPVAPLDKQQSASDLVERRVAAEDSAIKAIMRQIELLREHRQALITAAVTGELKVPGVAA